MSQSEFIRVCGFCGKEFKTTIENQIYCSPSHRIQAANLKWRMGGGKQNFSDYQKRHIKELRDNVYTLFGNKCAICGINDQDVLVIDHIEPVGKNRKLTLTLYYEILKDPEQAKTKYQLLCRNCNWKKMIENNERNNHEQPYAYEWQLQALFEEVVKLINLEETTKTIKKEEPSLETLCSMIEPYLSQCSDGHTIIAAKLRTLFYEKLGVKIGHNKSYELKSLIEFRKTKEKSV